MTAREGEGVFDGISGANQGRYALVVLRPYATPADLDAKIRRFFHSRFFFLIFPADRLLSLSRANRTVSRTHAVSKLPLAVDRFPRCVDENSYPQDIREILRTNRMYCFCEPSEIRKRWVESVFKRKRRGFLPIPIVHHFVILMGYPCENVETAVSVFAWNSIKRT